MILNKSLLTNLICVLAILIGYFPTPFYGQKILLSAGLFGFSGSITNWLAIQMIFEKVPFIYGSGVIVLRFESFKTAIRTMILENFFNEENFDRLKSKKLVHLTNQEQIIEKIDLNSLFDEMKSLVLESQLGSMIQMFGGEEIIENFREGFLARAKTKLPQLLQEMDIDSILNQAMDFNNLQEDVTALIDARLAELTPRHVKEIVEKMIKEHLSWLVVWGGVFGGLIGFFSTLLF